ncbi:MAG: hypothetical protein CL460_09025 [Acidimicrobiaceae bacterium]|jgi:uncharacterized protein with GYD domain|nr:hypothetical protein [Acidimicrobiaceae bacterium]|tara:strand:+ start:726 stop:1175 length:450 start_codon:yes stop_codon:yes gene_type:complete
MPYEYSTKYGSRFPRKVQGSFAGGLCPDWVRVGRETDIEKGETMPKIVLHGKYSQEAWEGLDATGTSARKEAVGALLASTGASLEAMYMMPGSNWDFMMIVDNASAESMAAVKKAVGPTGAVLESNATVIMTPEEFDAAGSGDYSAPGQ